MRETEVETKRARKREKGAGGRTGGKKQAEINRVTKDRTKAHQESWTARDR